VDATVSSSLFGGALPRINAQTDARLTAPVAASNLPAAGATAASTDASWVSLAAGVAGPIPSAPTGSVNLSVGTPVGEPGFAQDLARGMVYLARSGSQSAELSLHPADLGPVRVELQMDGQQASLVISAGHEATRSALHEALPQLHALFEQSGLRLTGAQIGDGSQSSAGGDSGRQGFGGDAASGQSLPGQTTGAAADAIPVPLPAVRRVGLVDTFA
jgi:flagellar hook-length control protein FliK